ncbi:hypothetical protein Tco_0862134, partial [Tanacetum coccineum]
MLYHKEEVFHLKEVVLLDKQLILVREMGSLLLSPQQVVFGDQDQLKQTKSPKTIRTSTDSFKRQRNCRQWVLQAPKNTFQTIRRLKVDLLLLVKVKVELQEK